VDASRGRVPTREREGERERGGERGRERGWVGGGGSKGEIERNRDRDREIDSERERGRGKETMIFTVHSDPARLLMIPPSPGLLRLLPHALES
jgi:hypothetical protein